MSVDEPAPITREPSAQRRFRVCVMASTHPGAPPIPRGSSETQTEFSSSVSCRTCLGAFTSEIVRSLGQALAAANVSEPSPPTSASSAAA